MTDAEIRKANDILDKFDFFSQRAVRELWSDKPKDIQDKDIENFLNDVKFLKDLINRQKAEIERLKRLLEEEEAKYKECAKRFYKEAIKEFASAYKDQIKNYTGMFTDEGFYVSHEAVLSAADFVLNRMVGDKE